MIGSLRKYLKIHILTLEKIFKTKLKFYSKESI